MPEHKAADDTVLLEFEFDEHSTWAGKAALIERDGNRLLMRESGYEHPSENATEVAFLVYDKMSTAPRLFDAEYRALLDLLICSDPWPIADDNGDTAHRTLIALADREALARGYDGGWVVAFHELKPETETGQ